MSDINQMNDDLTRAAKSGRPQIVRMLLDQLGDMAVLPPAIGAAAKRGRLEVVKILAARGADTHCGDEYAMRKAAQNDHLEVLRYLVEYCDADVQAEENFALIEATTNGHLDVVKYLLDHGADVHARNGQAIIEAACAKQRDIFKLLVECGGDEHLSEMKLP